jgi:hypothetical protein
MKQETKDKRIGNQNWRKRKKHGNPAVRPDDKRLNNQFWKLRAKHGRDRIFTEPQILEDAANEYFDWIDNNPLTKQEVLKGGEHAGKIVTVEIGRPYLIEALCEYLGVCVQYFNQFERSLDVENNETHKDFLSVISHIRSRISRQKLEGAAVGIFNPLIVSRIEGLKDRQEVTQQSEIKVSVSDSEARKIAKSIKDSI